MTEIVPNGYSVDGFGNIRLFHVADGVEVVDVPFTQMAYDEVLQTIADREAARLAQTPPSA